MLSVVLLDADADTTADDDVTDEDELDAADVLEFEKPGNDITGDAVHETLRLTPPLGKVLPVLLPPA